MHRKAPSIMLGAFVAGIAFAVGHHFFYHSLNGKAVGFTTFNQQVNIGAGTAFAFLVKTCLVLAVGTAFVQVLWPCLTAKSASVARIDSVTQFLTSFIELFNLRTLTQYPLLTFLAVVSWTLPLAAIVPPATLSIVTSAASLRSFGLRSVPNLDFANLSCGRTFKLLTTESNKISFGGSFRNMTVVAFSTALSASIPRISPPSPNSSYGMQFYGPSVQCSKTPVTIMDGFIPVLGCETTESLSLCTSDYSYLSWVPEEGKRVPFTNSSSFGVPIDFGNMRSGGYSDDEPAVIYVAIKYSLDWSVLNCSLYNTSYAVIFNYSGGDQSIQILREYLHSVPYHLEVSFSPCSQFESCNTTTYMTPAGVNYMGVMDSFGKILVGSMTFDVDNIENSPGLMGLVFDTRDTFFPLLNFADASNEGEGIVNGTASYFAQGLEQLFENITVGLLANTPMFTTDANLYASSIANVTFISYPNIYVYNWRHLILSYGLAVLFTTICVGIGCYNMLYSGHSFSFTFSTIARVTRDPAWNRLIRVEDTNGVDPVPKHMSDVKMPVGSLDPPLSKHQADPEDAPLKHGEVVQIHIDNSMDGEELRYLMAPNQVSGRDGFEQPSTDLRRR